MWYVISSMVCNGKQHGLQQYTDSWITTVYGPCITTVNARVSNVDYSRTWKSCTETYVLLCTRPYGETMHSFALCSLYSSSKSMIRNADFQYSTISFGNLRCHRWISFQMVLCNPPQHMQNQCDTPPSWSAVRQVSRRWFQPWRKMKSEECIQHDACQSTWLTRASITWNQWKHVSTC